MRVGISLVEVYERVGKSVISVCKKVSQKTDAFYGCQKVEEMFLFCNLFIILKTVHLQKLQRDTKFEPWGRAYPYKPLLSTSPTLAPKEIFPQQCHTVEKMQFKNEWGLSKENLLYLFDISGIKKGCMKRDKGILPPPPQPLRY